MIPSKKQKQTKIYAKKDTFFHISKQRKSTFFRDDQHKCRYATGGNLIRIFLLLRKHSSKEETSVLYFFLAFSWHFYSFFSLLHLQLCVPTHKQERGGHFFIPEGNTESVTKKSFPLFCLLQRWCNKKRLRKRKLDAPGPSYRTHVLSTFFITFL